MFITYSKTKTGAIKQINIGDFVIPFREDCGPQFIVKKENAIQNIELENCNEKYIGCFEDVKYGLSYTVEDEYILIRSTIHNNSKYDYKPDSIDLKIGIDSYMDSYPQWNYKFFPTMLRCEKTHFHGYFMSPEGKILAIASPDPIASYNLYYNVLGPQSFGHRIFTASLSLIHTPPLPERHPSHLDALNKNGKINYNIFLIPLSNLNEYTQKVSKICKIPIISSELYTVSIGDRINVSVSCEENYKLLITDPEYKEISDPIAKKHGMYTVKVITDSGKISEASFFCRRTWDWYLKAARKEAILKPQKATTHVESWYGLFSGFLAAKHYPDEKLDKIIEDNFNEIAPLMFDMEKAEPLVITERIQNTALFISLLVDKYQANPSKNKDDLVLASRFGDWLISRQTDDGVYRRDNIHYTCVIYIAKAMLELAEAEKSEGFDWSERHYKSAERSIDELVKHLEDIGTEGEHTFEDGMISCSALQIGMFALTLPEEKRGRYIEAAEYMINRHCCLEQNIIPDCRMNGGSLRFWEAQYDVMIMANMISSPHGWTAWTIYAKYYLYLLTGKEKYLNQVFNSMGSCVQLMSLSGNLRWAFAVDPYIKAEIFEPDESKPIHDGYKFVNIDKEAYRGKFVEKVIGEQYIDMISGWYRTDLQQITGGFYNCPLFLKNNIMTVDNQGGCCDNDVHEIFKCLEETVLKQAFVLEREGGAIKSYNCRVEIKNNIIYINSDEDIEFLHTNFKNEHTIDLNNELKTINSGMKVHKIIF